MESKLNLDPANLIELSKDAMKNTYSGYSKFPVGAALLCEDGTIYTGTNVENASYGLTMCAERTAVFKAVTEGNRKFVAIAISAKNLDDFIYPCGPCRQVLAEFGNMDLKVYASKPDLSYQENTLSELLPHHFQ